MSRRSNPNLASWAWNLALLLAAGQGLAHPAGAETVPLNNFSVPPGATVTITFDVDVKNPLAVCATSVANQGSFSGSNLTPAVATDDPDVGGTANPTTTGLDAVDLSITKTDGAATEVPGTPVTYTITVTNAGPSAAVGASVTDTFPASLSGVTWTCVGGGGATCTAAGSGNLSDTVNVPVGGTVTYTVNATISADASGTLANTATVTAMGQLECDTANNSATDTDTLTPQVDLAITKTDGVTSVDAGGSTTYTLAVSNSGPSDAIGATVADTFPAAIASTSWTCVASALSSCTAGPAAGNINDVVTVRAGGTLTYTVIANVSGAASGSLINTATVTAPGGTTDTNAGNNSATDTDTINPVADLSITKTDGVTTGVPGMSVTYTIVASNAGPATATGASVSDTFPATLTCNWTCVGAGGGTCTAGPVAGNIADSVNLPAGGSATYTAVCTIADAATGSVVNTATISGGGVTDTAPGNNSATDTDTLLTLDFGDAPDGSLAAPSGYPTLLADNGARHGVTVLKMGPAIDSETNGQPTVGADGDDLNGATPDDEDGVSLPAFVITCETTSVTVNASAVARLDAWIDWNANGSWADAGDKIFDNQALVAGANVLPVVVPCTATPSAKTFARFRLSTAGGLAMTGVAADGEVEDYTLAIRGVDFGDAPDPTFPTLFASNGARHVVDPSSPGPFLGALRDTEANGQPNAGSTGDDLAGVDDEDGVLFTTALIPGQSASVTVTATAPGNLRAWVDWDGDGSWATVGDELVLSPGATLVAGPNALTFTVPATANSNLTTFARFRFASVAVAGFTGLENDGEVEDHQVQTVPVADVSITKTDGLTTETPGTPVTYTITASNAGPDGVTGATVTDTFPAVISGVTWTCVGAGGGTCTAAGAGNLNESVNLPSGGSVTFTVTGTIDAAASGTLVNTANVAVPPPVFDPNGANNSATDTDTLAAQADLAVTKTDGAASEIPGTPVTYTIVASNAGPSVATSVSVADTFPASLSGCSWTSVAAGGATGNTAGPVAGNIAESGLTLPPASSVTYTATCSIDPLARGSVANTATVSSVVTDPVPANNSATDTDTLTPEVDLAVVKVESADPVTAGSGANNLTHTVTVTNNGPSTATTVTLSDVITVPAGTTVVSATPSQGTFTSPNWTLGTLAPAGSATLTVVYTVGASTATGTDTVCDTATVTGAAETLISTGNDADTECTSVQRRVDLVVSKTESIDPVVAGSGAGNLTYMVTVANNGPSDASGIALSEVLTLPAGVTVDSATPSQGSFVSPTWTVGNLASGGSATLTVVLTASSATVPGTDVICDTATLTAVNETQVGTGNESDTECTSVITSADLSITKVDDADPPPAASNLTYTITVTNNGPSNATGVVVTDPLPAAVTYVSDTCGASNVPPWTWNIGNLADGDSVSCDVVVSINPTPPASISNTATVTATTNDGVGSNNSDTEDTTLDAVPPQVANLTTFADTADGSLTECETVNDRKVNGFLVAFDEAMVETGAGSVTDPANYRLFQPGPNQLFDSTGCTLAGDDLEVTLAGVSYDGGTTTATVSTAAALGDSPYRFVACDTLTDAAGNALDGDGNGSPGPGLVRGFRNDPLNLFGNGHFDCDLTGWTVTAATAGEITHGTADVDGAPLSGSARATNLAPGTDTTFTLDQCVPVVGGVNATLSSRARLAAAATVSINLIRECEFYSGVCTGSVGTVSDVVALLDTGGTWLPRVTVVPIPPAALTASCRFRFETPTAQTFTGELDRLLFRLDGAIFADGFESGDTAGWSLCSGTGCAP
jgi:uncharacterized repeat protein (TIGR01451 family)